MSTAVETAIDIRPFHVDVLQEELDDLSEINRRANSRRRFANSRATGDEVRLAEVRGAAECPAAIRHRDRWADSDRWANLAKKVTVELADGGGFK